MYRSVLLSSYEKISSAYDIPDGAEYFIYDTALSSVSSSDFFNKLTTKTYTYARLRRIILYAVTGVTNIDKEPLYTVLLAANKNGRDLVKRIKSSESIHILTKMSDSKKHGDIASQLELSTNVDKLYYSFIKENISPNEYIKKKPYIEK